MTSDPSEVERARGAIDRIPVATKLAFGFGDFATSTIIIGVNIFLLFFYTQVLGLEGALAGLALAPHHTSRLAHMMVETPTIDEVGYCIEGCQNKDVEIAQTLGRHTNDRMLSFYMRAPRGYEVEYGCDGLRVDEDDWATQEITAVSFWGHRRLKK